MSKVSTFIGLRYLRSKKSSAFLSLITFLSVAGIALGVATLIVTLSVMDGFEGALKGRLAQGEFHILATAAADQTEAYFEFTPEQVNRVFALSPDIQSVNPVLSTEAILRAGKRVAGMSMRGVTESQTNLLAKMLVESVEGPKVLSSDGLWLGRELAYQLSAFPGDKVQVISPTETEGPMESVPRVRVFRVDGIFSSGIPEKDLHTVYAPLSAVQEFLGRPGRVNRLEVSVKDFDHSEESGQLIRQELGPSYLVKDWNQLNAHLFASLKLERMTMFVILTMIVLQYRYLSPDDGNGETKRDRHPASHGRQPDADRENLPRAGGGDRKPRHGAGADHRARAKPISAAVSARGVARYFLRPHSPRENLSTFCDTSSSNRVCHCAASCLLPGPLRSQTGSAGGDP